MSARILLLEDDPAIAGTVAFALQREGWSVEHVLLCGAARESVAAGPPALAILDVGLPDGSGLDLMRTLSPRIRGIRLSGYGMESDLQRSREDGFSIHLVKPVDLQQLSAAIAEVVDCPTPAT